MATKTIDYLGFRMDVTPYEHEGNTFNRLSVSVGYQKGRGFYVTLHPVLADGGELYDFSRNPLSDTTWINVEQATKNNSKRLTAIYENVKQGQEAVRLCFDARKWERMEFIIVNLAAHGYADWLKEDVGKFFETTSDNNQNNSEDEVMTNETMKVADLIGKSISNGGNAKYTINSIEGDKVKVTFQMGDSEGKPMTMGVAQVEKLLQGGWTVSDGTQEPTEKKADGGSQKAEEPKAKTVKMTSEREQSGTRSGSAERESSRPQGKMEPEPKPKAEKPKVTLKRKQPQTEAKAEEPKQEHKAGKLVYSAYTNAKGKTCAKVSGFAETDAAYQKEAAASLHGSATYENTKQGRVNFLLFGPRYAEVAKTVCQMLNEGKTVADCQAVVDAATEERAQKREEWKQKRAAYRQEHEGKAQTAKPQGEKLYTAKEIADLMERVMRGDADALAEVNAIKAKAA